MSVVNGKGEGERRRQAAWFGIEAEPGVAAEGEGPFAGVVFNRPVDRVFTYRVPAHLRATIGPGQRLRVPRGRASLGRWEERLSIADVCRMAKCAPGPIAALRRRGYVHTVRRRLRPTPPAEPSPPEEADPSRLRPAPTGEQRAVLDRLAP